MSNGVIIERKPVLTALTSMEKRIQAAIEDTVYNVSNYSLFARLKTSYQPVSNFVVVPVGIITKDNGRTEEIFVKVTGYTADGQLPEVRLSLKEFERMDWITSKWGFVPVIEVTKSAEKHIRRAAQWIGRITAEKSTIYTHTGWKNIDGKWAYLHGGGAIGQNNVTVELESNMSGYTLPVSSGNYQEAIAASYSLKKAAALDLTIPLLALAYLSPLNEFFKQAGHEPAFIVMLAGHTSAKKSTLAALTLNHFGASFTPKSMPGNFKDTANALEAKAFLLKDTLNVIDDFHPTSQNGEYSKMTTTMQLLLRSYGDRVGRGRLSSDAKLKDAYIPRGNLLVTGEDIPKVEESGLARLFLLEVEQGSIDKKAVLELQGKTELLAQAMRGYIEWLAPQSDSLPNILVRKFLENRQQAQKDDIHSRIPETIAWLHIGYEMFVDYAIINGVIQEDERQALLDEAWGIIVSVSDKQNKLITSDNPVSLFLSALNELFATRKCYCITFDNDDLPEDPNDRSSGFLGFVDKEYYYLFPDTMMTAIVSFYERLGMRFPSSKNKLLKLLANEDKIAFSTTDRTNNTKVKDVYGEKHRFLWLKRSALDSMYWTNNHKS